eukprot:SAG11_NODE_10880_length_799_cov_1.492857_1_plen_107_part_01
MCYWVMHQLMCLMALVLVQARIRLKYYFEYWRGRGHRYTKWKIRYDSCLRRYTGVTTLYEHEHTFFKIRSLDMEHALVPSASFISRVLWCDVFFATIPLPVELVPRP